MTIQPLVSCLLVTKATPERLRLLKKNLQLFKRQSYKRTELIVVADHASKVNFIQLTSLIAETGINNVKIYNTPKPMTLGALRNLSIKKASGTVLCQWDDDDFNHPDRIKIQLYGMLKNKSQASYLGHTTNFFKNTGELFEVDWSASGLKCHPGTMMCYKSAASSYPSKGKFATKHEDTAFLLDLAKKYDVSIIRGLPHLFVYVFHGKNTFSSDHHRSLLSLMKSDRKKIKGLTGIQKLMRQK